MGAINQKTGAYRIDGIAVIDPQVPSKFQLNTTGIFQRNMSATRTGRVVANMKKVFWTYKRLTESQLNEICSIIYSKLVQGNDVFTIQTKIPGTGQIYIDNFYLGQPFEIQSLENPGLYKLDIHWIQVDGKLGLGTVSSISSVIASPATLDAVGGDVTVTISGSGIYTGMIVGAYSGNELIGQTSSTSAVQNNQVATLSIPANTSELSRSLTIKVLFNGGFDSHTSTIVQSGAGGD